MHTSVARPNHDAITLGALAKEIIYNVIVGFTISSTLTDSRADFSQYTMLKTARKGLHVR